MMWNVFIIRISGAESQEGTKTVCITVNCLLAKSMCQVQESQWCQQKPLKLKSCASAVSAGCRFICTRGGSYPHHYILLLRRVCLLNVSL